MKYRSDINNIHDKSYKDLLSSKDGFDKLTEDDKRRLSKWLRVTLSDGFKDAISDEEDILLTSKEGFDRMTANFVKSMEKTLREERVEGDTNRAKIGVKNMLKDNMDKETISKLLEVDITFIDECIRSMDLEDNKGC